MVGSPFVIPLFRASEAIVINLTTSNISPEGGSALYHGARITIKMRRILFVVRYHHVTRHHVLAYRGTSRVTSHPTAPRRAASHALPDARSGVQRRPPDPGRRAGSEDPRPSVAWRGGRAPETAESLAKGARASHDGNTVCQVGTARSSALLSRDHGFSNIDFLVGETFSAQAWLWHVGLHK